MIPTNYDDDDEEDDMTGFEVENDPSLTYAMQIQAFFLAKQTEKRQTGRQY